ncbi:hypothetical protein PSTG_14078 [Puccinia striiformis f. sp. tritici PST-78]|uniref:Tet-like 2OG-Fe(II) oxygenase domain-containing protein n=1 Tax=Puccinia striiformis f. sp. tritici PST-78 TaxID=1165861 RepID=A0A0L0UZV9_9BASI|nr:hypothetical protein PSTG_14078 [Puccinia striiformis f. sp. tritici PST-78]
MAIIFNVGDWVEFRRGCSLTLSICPEVESIEETQRFLAQAKHIISPDQPTAILTNFNTELGLFVKQTKWSDMPKEEYQELEFLTTTLIELGKFYNDLENASLISGIMRGFGWRKAYGTHKEHCGIYTPSGIQNEEDYLRWKELLVRLPKVESIISKRFQKLAPGLFKKSVNKMKSAKLPSFASLEFDQASPMPFASNLTATWNEFSNESHIDNDVSPISYGGWCGITEDSGMLASRLRGFDIQHGQFFLPGISTVVDFSAVDGWTDVFWNSNLLYHQTVQSSRPANSPFTRFAFSVQITKPLFDGCQAILGKSGIKFGGFNERDARVKSLIFPSCE